MTASVKRGLGARFLIKEDERQDNDKEKDNSGDNSQKQHAGLKERGHSAASP
jgi:hypothetical protein